MGLDMYLYASKHVGGMVFTKQDGTVDDSSKDPLFDPIKALLGDVPFGDWAPSLTIQVKTAYWRKANQIHKWFVDNVQGGVDECQESYVAREQLEELRDLCKRILDTEDPVTQRALIEEHLPPESGFFFGSTEVDEYYIEDLQDTVKQLTAALESKTLQSEGGIFGWTFYYQSSW